jgi:hypothetical protein
LIEIDPNGLIGQYDETKFMHGKVKITFVLFFVPIILLDISPTKCWAQVDSSMVRDTLGTPIPDTTNVDSVLVDSLNAELGQDSLTGRVDVIENDASYPFYRKEETTIEQQKLPRPDSWSLTDTSNLGARFFEAIKNRFTKPAVAIDSTEGSHLFMVLGGSDTLYAEAMVEGYPFYRSYVNHLRAENSMDEKELKELKDTLDYSYKRGLNVQLTLRSYNTKAVALDTSLWEVYMKAGDIQLSPQKIVRLPISTKVWGKLAWYERKILLRFPRFAGANDLMFDPRMTLRLDMRKQSVDSTVYKSYYAFRFTEIIEGGTQYQQK